MPPDAKSRSTPFPATVWKQIVSARDGTSSEVQEALAQLCQSYWYPIYAFIRRKGHSAHDAQDLTQDFFVQLLRRDWLTNVGPEKGKFRSFLLACLRNFLLNEWERGQALIRNPGPVTIDLGIAEDL